MLTRLAASAETRVLEWGDFDWHKTEHAHLAGGQKRRRVDHHVRQYTMKTSLQNGTHQSSSAAARSLDDVSSSQTVRWMQSEMSAYRAGGLLSMHGAQQIAIAIDATRLGKPAKDILLGMASDVQRQTHLALPPQESCGIVRPSPPPMVPSSPKRPPPPTHRDPTAWQ